MIEFSGVAPGHYELATPEPPRVYDLDATISEQVDPTSGIPTVAVSGTLQTPTGVSLPGDAVVILDSLDPAHRQYSIQTNCIRGLFNFASVPPGAWELWAGSPEKMLPITSLAAGGRTYAGNQLTVRDHALNLVVNIGLGETRVEGFARAGNRGVAGVMVVLIPQNSVVWRGLIRRDQSDSDGSFSLRDVVPGKYTVVAIQDGWTLDWTDPQVLSRYLSAGIPVTVTDASGKLVTLSFPVPVQIR